MAGRGRPVNRAGQRRKEALIHAWEVASALTATQLAESAGIAEPGGTKTTRVRLLYQILRRGSPHQPSAKVLGRVAMLFDEHASRLRAEGKRLREVVEETEREGPSEDVPERARPKTLRGRKHGQSDAR